MTAILDDDVDLDAEPGRRRPRLLWLTLGVVVVTAGAGAGYWLLNRDDGAETVDLTAAPAATTEVTRGTLSATETWNGTLGHGDAHTTVAASPGVITRVAAQDSAVKRGTELYRLNEQPVTALIGAIPMYRDLAVGDTGVDVEQLEGDLAKLGYDGFTVDDEFTAATEQAVLAWQEDIGAAETGVVTRADVVFLPAGGRVDTVLADVGAVVTPGSPVVDVTGAGQVVSFEADVTDRDLLTVGTPVSVVLPDGAEVAGTVAESSVVAAAEDDSGGGAGGGSGDDGSSSAQDTAAEIEVALTKPADAGFVGAPADVVVAVDERVDVLVAPVNALLALADGGYGLEVVADDGSTSIVPVETGLFADGKVEVSGGGLAEGTMVGMAGR